MPARICLSSMRLAISIMPFMTPRQARAAGVPLKVLTPDEARTLEALGDTIHPGAAEAGLVQFIDYQLALDPDDCRSLLKYFVNDPPFADFYRAGLRSLEGLSLAKHQKAFPDLDAAARAVVRTPKVAGAAPLSEPGPPDILSPEEVSPSKKITLTIVNEIGLHARPAALFVQTAGSFQSAITVRNLTQSTPAYLYSLLP